jgi:hypothetical protein
MAVTHDMAHSFDVALPVKTDEGGESHRARHGTGKSHGVASRRKYMSHDRLSMSFPGTFGHAEIVDAGDIKRLVAEAFRADPFERVAAGRWQARTEELIWAFDLDRGRSWSAWSVMAGILVREWHAGLAVPGHHDGDVIVEYPVLGDAVPPAAAMSRFDDHRSYFTMVFDHRHDLAGEDERRAAFAFMAGDLARLVRELPTVADLRAAVAAGLFNSGFVCRGLQKAQA